VSSEIIVVMSITNDNFINHLVAIRGIFKNDPAALFKIVSVVCILDIPDTLVVS
jgi:hypothetical protein